MVSAIGEIKVCVGGGINFLKGKIGLGFIEKIIFERREKQRGVSEYLFIVSFYEVGLWKPCPITFGFTELT